jgi:hypothetical protein
LSLGKIVQVEVPGVGVAVGAGSVAVRAGVTVRVGVRVGVGVETGGGVGVHVAVRICGGLTVLVGLRLACAGLGAASGRRKTSAGTPRADTRDLVFMGRLQTKFRYRGRAVTGSMIVRKD